ncbi:MAG: hypothetical protein JWR37_5040, partial [Mycobacterium sp.]|nr:hypothetical protein [Mycobacterium sp.]
MTEPHHAVISRLSADFAAMSRQLARVSGDLTELERLIANPAPAPQRAVTPQYPPPVAGYWPPQYPYQGAAAPPPMPPA